MPATSRRRARAFGPAAAAACLAAAGLLACAPARAETDAPAPAAGGGSSALRGFLSDVIGIKGARGQIRAKRVTYLTFPPAMDVVAGLHVTREGDWRFENIRGDQCGGTVTGRADISFGGPDRKFVFDASWVGVKLEEVTRHTKRPVTPGVLSARAELRASSRGRQDLSGDIRAEVRNGSLGQFPMVLKVLSLLSFPGLEREQIENADARITLTPRAIVFQDLSLGSADGAFRLEAERLGSVGYDGALDLYFRPVLESRFLARVPAVGELVNKIIDDIQQRGMRIHVTGDTAEPRFQWAAFKVGRN